MGRQKREPPVDEDEDEWAGPAMAVRVEGIEMMRGLQRKTKRDKLRRHVLTVVLAASLIVVRRFGSKLTSSRDAYVDVDVAESERGGRLEPQTTRLRCCPTGSHLSLAAIDDHNFSLLSSSSPSPHIITMASRFFAPATLRSAAARAPSAVARRQAPTAVPRRFASGSAHKDPLLAEQEHATEHAAKSADLWRKISMYFCLPGAWVERVIEAELDCCR